MSFKDYGQQAYDWLTGQTTLKVEAEIDTEKLYSVRLIAVRGTASGGSATTVVDDTKNYPADLYKGKVIKVTVDDVDYYRLITACSGDTLTFATITETVAKGCPYEVLG